MNKQTLIILGGGLLAALVVALVMQAMVGSPQPVQTVTQEAPKSEVLVAARVLEMGSVLDPDDMKWQQWPTNAVFSGAITRDSLENPNASLPIEGRLRRTVVEGEPLMRTALVQESGGNFISATLSDGMRAMAIEINAQSSVGGFVKPGDMVDVIMTYNVIIPSDEEIAEASRMVINRQASQTVLENIKVMAVDQSATDSEDIAVGRTVTLELTPEQTERLALAGSMGDLSLALRKIGDDTQRLTGENTPPSITDVRMSQILQEIINAEGGEFETGSARTIKLYNGNQIQEITVEPYSGNR